MYKRQAPSFEAEEVKVFGAMYKKGYIYKGLKPVYWPKKKSLPRLPRPAADAKRMPRC